jgi:hypothetical protein
MNQSNVVQCSMQVANVLLRCDTRRSDGAAALNLSLLALCAIVARIERQRAV